MYQLPLILVLYWCISLLYTKYLLKYLGNKSCSLLKMKANVIYYNFFFTDHHCHEDNIKQIDVVEHMNLSDYFGVEYRFSIILLFRLFFRTHLCEFFS